MQHLEEGTIHAWLDGALSPDEAARAAAHVVECPRCASAVAEARGFIAASSRILTALDNAPRGVIPAATPRKRVHPLVWRVAAMVLVVAGGTLVVVRNYGNNERPISIATSTAVSSRPQTSASDQAPAVMAPAVSTSPARTVEVAPSSPPRIPPSRKAMTPSARVDFGAAENNALARSAPGVAGGVAMDAAGEPLKVIATPRRIGEKVTLYEVAPGDTVTLSESIPMQLSRVVTTGATRPMAQAAGKSAAVPSKERANAPVAAAAPDSQRVSGAIASVPNILANDQVSQAKMADAIHTIRWTDSATGSTLTLTGRMPEARLQEIRIRIERERATARKNP
jgi:Putative zinc-finger